MYQFRIVKSTWIFIISAKLTPKTCKTAENSPFNANQKCTFPFTYNGKTFRKCSNVKTVLGLLENICATETKGDNNEMVEFGICGQECDTALENGKWIVLPRKSNLDWSCFEFQMDQNPFY